MKNFQVITLQQETGYHFYLELCKEVDEEPSSQGFITFYILWCSEEGLFKDLASYQYHEQEEHEDENEDLDEEEEEDEEQETYRVAVWVSDCGFDSVPLTIEEDAHLTEEDLMQKAVKEFRENSICKFDVIYDFCTECEQRESESEEDYVEPRDEKYCEKCQKVMMGRTKNYCLEDGETRDGRIVFEMWEK